MVGELIRARRVALGLSQTELARRAGSSQRQVSRLENGEERTMPRRETLDRFGAVLDITLADFYRAGGVMDPAELETPASPDDPLEVMVERVRRNASMMRDLRRAQEINDPEVFERILAAVADAWLANLKMAMAVNSAESDPVPPGP